AIFGERRRIEHAVGELAAVAALAGHDTLADLFSGQLAADRSVPFSVADERTARQFLAVRQREVVSDDSPPADRERRVRPPVSAAKPQPMVRNSKRREYMLLVAPFREERALDRGPV